MIIEHTFVINLKERTDRWEKINNKFDKTQLKLQRFDATYGKDLSQSYIDSATTPFCRQFCSNGMIGCWLSHYRLWKLIVKNYLNNVLILEDDAEPVDGFNEKIGVVLDSIPKDYDLVYIGCYGSCSEGGSIGYKYLLGGSNIDYNEHLMIPYSPYCTHAYLLSNKGANKLLNSKDMKKISYHVDYAIINNIYTNPDFKMYAVKSSLITQPADVNDSNITFNDHPLLSYLFSFISAENGYSLDYALNIETAHIRSISVDISIMLLILLIISMLVGAWNSKSLSQVYFQCLFTIFFIEIAIKLYHGKMKFNNTLFEFLMIPIFFYLGLMIRMYLN